MVAFPPNEGFYTQGIVIYKMITKVSECVKVIITKEQAIGTKLDYYKGL